MSEQQQDPGADPEAERVESLDHRFGAIETKQAEQDGKLDQILSRLTGGAGGGTKAPPRTPVGAAPGTDPGTIADQVRKAVEAVGAEQAAKAAQDQHAQDHAAIAEMREQQPRDSTAAGWRGKLQRAMYGGDR